MSNLKKSVIKIKKGAEYHVLVDDKKNIYDENMFFYPVYKKGADILEEICNLNSKKTENGKKESADDELCSNNLIMYCAERGGGKSSAMRTFAKLLSDFEEEKEKDCFTTLFSKNMKKYRFSVLKEIDPTAISSKDLFMRVILSRMFKELRDKLKDNFIYGDESEPNSLVSMFTECYRLLDVIYQKGGDFRCDDDLDDLSDLGDSCLLKDKFSKLVRNYLRIITENDNCENNFLVIQIDDADLNPEAAYGIIEDIRKYCIVPNVIILMAVHMKQMRYVLEQHFAVEFKPLLDASYQSKEEIKPIRLWDCQKMAVRYIDKVMPIGHQIHLPTIDDVILSRSSELSIEYYDENNINILPQSPDKEKTFDYQETLLGFIYERTGIPLVKATSYLHNILPKTMRGLSHFLAYMVNLEKLKLNYGIAEIDMLCNEDINDDDFKKMLSERELSVNDAKNELSKREKNIDLLEQYFLTNWCPIRLDHDHKFVIENIAAAVDEQKILSAVKWLDKLYNKDKMPKLDINILKVDINPELSKTSYAYLLEILRNINHSAHTIGNAAETYRFTYALKFYFTLFFNRLMLLDIEDNNKFERVLRISNYEVWEPRFENAPIYFLPSSLRFQIDSKVWNRYKDNRKEKDEKLICIIHEEKGCCPISGVVSKKVNVIFDMGALLLLRACKKPYNVKIGETTMLTEELSGRNLLFMLLLNWDIQRCAEKTDFHPNSSKGAAEDTVTDPEASADLIFSFLKEKLNYLSIPWEKIRLDKIFKMNDIISFRTDCENAAKGYLRDEDEEIIKKAVGELKEIVENIDAKNINADSIGELFGLMSSTKKEENVDKISRWIKFSKSIETAVSQWKCLDKNVIKFQKGEATKSTGSTIKRNISIIQKNLDAKKIIYEINSSMTEQKKE